MSRFKNIVTLIFAALLLLSLVSCQNNSRVVSSTTQRYSTMPTDESSSQPSEAVRTSSFTDVTAPSTLITTEPTWVTHTSTQRTTTRPPTTPPIVLQQADKAFIKSLKGFSMKILSPYKDPGAGSPLNDSFYFAIKEVEQCFGASIDVIYCHDGYSETLNSQLAAGLPTADICYVKNSDYFKYISYGYMTDLIPAMKTSFVTLTDPWINQNSSRVFSLNYKQYAYSVENRNPTLIYYLPDEISRVGLTDPCTLMKTNKWTWDTLSQYCKKLKTSSRAGLTCSSPSKLLEIMTQTYGGGLVNTSGAKLESSIKSSVTKNCLQKLFDWSTAGDVKFSGSAKATADALSSKNSAMIFCDDSILENLPSSLQGGKIGVVSAPAVSNGGKYINTEFDEYAEFIPSQKSANAAKILFLRNEILRINYRFEDRDFQVKNKNVIPLGSEAMSVKANLVFSRNGYTINCGLADWCEVASGDVSMSYIANEVATGGYTPQRAVNSWGTQLENYYSSRLGGYRLT